MKRRDFLAGASVLLGARIPVLLGVPILGYLLAPLFQPPPDDFVDVGNAADFASETVTLVRFKDPSSLPWAGQTADTAIWVRRPAGAPGDFQVFAENCTHLGCPVDWRAEARLFFCPCHGGVFYEDGRVAAGPPTEPLFEREWRVDKGRLLVRGTRLPTIRNRGT